jgi:hypothetical protein
MASNALLRDVSSATNGATAATSIAVPVPATAVAGDWALIIVSGEETTPVPTWGSSFTALAPSPAPTRANETINAGQKFLVSGDLSTSVTVSFTTSRARSAVMLVFQGPTIDPGSVEVSAGGAWTGGTTGTAPTVTTSQADDLLIVAYALQSNTQVAMSTPTGFTAGPTAVSTTTGSSISTFYKLDQVAAGATGAITSTWTGSMNGVGLTVAAKTQVGAPPAQTVGPTGISSGEAFGTASVTGGVVNVQPPGIPSAEAIGAPTVTGGAVTISPTGISSSEALGSPTVISGIDHSALFIDGDSLTYAENNTNSGTTALTNQLIAAGWPSGKVDVDANIGRFVDNPGDTNGGTPGAIDRLVALGYNPYTLVIPLGTNDTLNSLSSNWAGSLSNLRAKIAASLPGTHQILWVNVVADPTGGQGMDGAIGTKGNTVAQWNSFLAANLGSGESILDWNAYAKANLTSSSYWQNDANHVHMTPAGYTTRQNWLVGQLASSAPVQTVGPNGVASGGAFGTATVTTGAVTVAPSGALSSEAFGAPTVSPGPVSIAPAGIPSSEALGSPTLTVGSTTVAPTGVGSAEAFGSPAVTGGVVTIFPPAIGSAEALGAPGITAGSVTVSPAGIGSAAGLGAPSVQPGTVTVSPAGIGSSEAFGTAVVTTGAPPVLVVSPAGVGSGEAFGISTVTGGGPSTLTIAPPGISSAEAIGAPTVTTIVIGGRLITISVTTGTDRWTVTTQGAPA